MSSVRIAKVDPVFSWCRKHESVSQLKMHSAFLVELPAHMAQSAEISIAKGNVLQDWHEVSSEKHPYRIYGADGDNDDREAYFSSLAIVTSQIPDCPEKEESRQQKDVPQ
jgi:hypothetical protein